MGKKLGPGDLVETRCHTILERVLDPNNKIDWDNFEDMFDEMYPGIPMVITGFDEHDNHWLRVMHVGAGKEYFVQKRSIRRVKV